MCPERQTEKKTEIATDIALDIEINQKKKFFSSFAIGNV